MDPGHPAALADAAENILRQMHILSDCMILISILMIVFVAIVLMDAILRWTR